MERRRDPPFFCVQFRLSCETDSVTSQEQAAETFYGGALPRITGVMPVLAVGVLPLLLWFWRWPVAVAFGIGALISIYNFWSLSRSVNALAERITVGQSRESGGRIVAMLLLRYLLIGAVAYVIFKSSPAAVYGLLGGLSLPVAAISCEAVFELYIALRRGL
jgi:ATP synthase I chain